MIAGVLLAAGSGERFGGAKLLATLPGTGEALGIVALRNLRAVLPEVVAVVRPGDDELAARFVAEGARVVRAERAAEGMGASLAAGVGAAGAADGWVVALADMPWIRRRTLAAVVAALAQGATIVAPRHQRVRGHPVGFAAALRDELTSLDGDEGARRVLAAHEAALVTVDVDDPGVLRDVDVPADLR